MTSPRAQVHASYEALCQAVAARIAQLIRAKPDAVLGLATGSTPIGVYRELIRLHAEENLDFARVQSFNLDEYFPIQPDAPQSYHRFMREQLFDHINCSRWQVPDGGRAGADEVRARCQAYEAAIRDAGGLDFLLLGIGRTGHVGFNEPGSGRDSRTRLVTLDSLTRADAAPAFFGLENVPARAITMGIATILEAREVAILASGSRKAEVVALALEGPATSKLPATWLREHASCAWHLDEAAASRLSSRLQAPDARRSRLRAALEGAAELRAEEVEELKSRCENGKYLPQGRRVLCLSPHPDDDVICCGATLQKMAARANEITIAYLVSGSNAVRDKDVLALLRSGRASLTEHLQQSLLPSQGFEDGLNRVRREIFEREPGQSDSALLRDLKRLAREDEARDAAAKIGAEPRFLDLPFYYEREHRAGDADSERVLALLRAARPELVLLTGEMNDPHGTHEQCARAFEQAARKYLQQGGQGFAQWHYRGAWDEFAVEEGDYFSVFGREEMERKIGLILDHLSQLDPLFPGGSDRREFWERARERNRSTARQLQKLGVLPPSRSFEPLYAEVFRLA